MKSKEDLIKGIDELEKIALEAIAERDQLRADKEKAEQELARLQLDIGSAYVPAAELKEARELLEKIEWCVVNLNDRYECPICRNETDKGHTPDCKLQAFLAKTK